VIEDIGQGKIIEVFLSTLFLGLSVNIFVLPTYRVGKVSAIYSGNFSS
jgi:hypothetical protein